MSLPLITEMRVRALIVPLAQPLKTASGTVQAAPMLLLDVQTDAGVCGHAYIFTYTPLVLGAVKQLATDLTLLLEGQPLDPLGLMNNLRGRFMLIGTYGLLDMVLAGIDMAVWDAHAKHLELPLVRALGGSIGSGTAADGIPAYASFGMDGKADAVKHVATAVERGFKAIKIKIGYPTLQEDIAVVRAAIKATEGAARLMVDYNQSLDVAGAMMRCPALDDEGLLWIEEPTRYDDNCGHAQIAAAIKTPLQLGENLWGPRQVAESLRMKASDYMMPDLMKIGGVSGWMQAAGVCAANNVRVSNHFFQEISVHLLRVTPTAHYIEYFQMADPILVDPLQVRNGNAIVRDCPGNGIQWKEEAVERYTL